jgi:formamidopyrimidine-DNA glycosylase
MPELPEIETIRRGLERVLPGRRLHRVDVHDTRLRTPLRPAVLRRRLVGRRVAGVGRRAKYLLVRLDDGQVLVMHLGMSGRVSLLPGTRPLAAHTHVVIHLDSGKQLRFTDHRRFGMLFVVRGTHLERHPRFTHLGPEPLEASFSATYLLDRARGIRRPVKNFLMDAGVVVGVGNIYASEALHRARVHPNTAAMRLRLRRWERVHAAVCDTLGSALRAGGTTLNDFRSIDGSAGEFQVQLHVYGREGEACCRCGRAIRRVVQAGRSTFYCPACQR